MMMMMMMADRLWGLIQKETLQIFRDPSSILIAFIFPLILLFLFGFALSLDPENIQVGIVTENLSPTHRSLIQSFEASPYFKPTVSQAISPLMKKMKEGKLRGMIVLPQDLQSNERKTNKNLQIQLVTDGSQPTIAAALSGYTQGVVNTWWQDQQKAIWPSSANTNPDKLSTQVVSRYWFNSALDSSNFLVPGSIAVIMTIIGTLLTALVVSREWERGTMEVIISTQTSRFELLVGKVVPYFILGLGAVFVCFVISITLFQIPFRGSIGMLFLTVSGFLLVALGAGLLISTLAKNQFVASQIAVVTGYLPAFLLSGFAFEITSMPKPIQVITTIIPARYFVENLQTLYLAGDVGEFLWSRIGILFSMAFVLLGITFLNTSKRLN